MGTTAVYTWEGYFQILFLYNVHLLNDLLLGFALYAHKFYHIGVTSSVSGMR